jgi:hypothetical protein
MHQLAFIAVVDSSGKELKLPAADIAVVEEKSGGCVILLRDGRAYDLQTTAGEAFTAIDALWTAYLTALGDPA